MDKRKVIIIGAGHVGSHCGLALAYGGDVDEIVFIDIDKKKAKGQAMDINDAVSGLDKVVHVRAGSYKDAKDATIMVMAAGRSRKPGETRLDMFDDSIKMADEIIPHIKKSGFNGIYISISNPADVIFEYMRKKIGFSRQQAFCTGTGLDTFRLLRFIERETGYSRKSINGYMLGGHGDSSFPAYSLININGLSFKEMLIQKPKLAKIDWNKIVDEVHIVGFNEVESKGCTEFGIGTLVKKLVRAIVCDQKMVWPVSASLNGEYNQKGLSIGVPCVIGKKGIEEIIEVKLTAQEKKKFEQSSAIIKGFLSKTK